ncbi:hypothetical protein MJ561_13730 [Klebsiella pneumoniae]|nr:hypothetical protein MJ561_13730 [Klebsiella pneumoniae]
MGSGKLTLVDNVDGQADSTSSVSGTARSLQALLAAKPELAQNRTVSAGPPPETLFNRCRSCSKATRR